MLLRAKNSALLTIVQQHNKGIPFTASACPQVLTCIVQNEGFPSKSTNCSKILAINGETLKSHFFRDHTRKGQWRWLIHVRALPAQPVGRRMADYTSLDVPRVSHTRTTTIQHCAEVCLCLYSHHKDSHKSFPASCSLVTFLPMLYCLCLIIPFPVCFNRERLSASFLFSPSSSSQLVLHSVLAAVDSSWILHSLLPLWLLALLLLLNLAHSLLRSPSCLPPLVTLLYKHADTSTHTGPHMYTQSGAHTHVQYKCTSRGRCVRTQKGAEVTFVVCLKV